MECVFVWLVNTTCIISLSVIYFVSKFLSPLYLQNSTVDMLKRKSISKYFYGCWKIIFFRRQTLSYLTRNMNERLIKRYTFLVCWSSFKYEFQNKCVNFFVCFIFKILACRSEKTCCCNCCRRFGMLILIFLKLIYLWIFFYQRRRRSNFLTWI